ncbi:Regulator of chromosome condensation (RCC1) repeat protein [compost metagenome]
MKEDGSVWAWGLNYYGRVGDGTSNNAIYPVQVYNSSYSPLNNVIAVHAGEHSIALKADGTILTWGRSENGELGNNTTEIKYLATETLFPSIF